MALRGLSGPRDAQMPLIGTDTGLRLALDHHRKQVAALEAEMERRVNGGVPPDAARAVWSE
jgi:hypothetical protein